MQNNQEDDIVISGISGKFPQCNNMDELKEALYNGVDLVTENSARYPQGIWGLPSRSGVIPNVENFDLYYFNVHHKQAIVMDPRHKIVLETAYECIIDAGYNPKELKGSKTGVYVGISTLSNTEEIFSKSQDGYANLGMALALAANRISFAFNLHGPSYAIDTSCSSSLYALVCALDDMKSGEIDGAIVCATHLILHPSETSEFYKLQMLSKNGQCRTYCKNRGGYVRSETISSIFLQRKSKSRRIYATILGGKRNTDGYKIEGITFPSSDKQYDLMNELYLSMNIDPRIVSYVEAHGTGTVVGDIAETGAITKHFCKNRSEPLLVGAVKSNLGHSEIGAGMASLAKVILAMETGIIPANLHTETIDDSIPGIKDGKIEVVTTNKKWEGGIAGLCSYGFGGANAHVILQSHNKAKQNNFPRYKHRLVHVSGRTEEAVNHLLDEIEKNQDDAEFLALVDEIHKTIDDGHHFRGYCVLGDNKMREVSKCMDKQRPIWFVYTGMGSQWNQMGKDLMNIKIFRETIELCAKTLAPHGINLIDIMYSDDPAIFDDITNAFCGIISIEIAITNVLRTLGIVPDGMCGHSLGEVGCAYGDGFMKAEEGVMLAYARGYASINSEKIVGQMAAVGLPKDELSKILPEDIYIACYNSKNNNTISGPKEKTIAFVEQLNAQGIFAKLVNTGEIAYHTKYIHKAGELLLRMCKKFLTSCKPRSSKWISTSVPSNKQNEPWARINSPEYHHNNFCGPVLFEQVYDHIPKNAIVLEVAPHGLLQGILKKQMPEETTNIRLTNRLAENNESFFLAALGKYYLAGGQFNLRNLYNDVIFPVSRGTKMISPLVKWDHSTPTSDIFWKHKSEYGNSINVSLSDEKYSYLSGHDIDGRILMPATGYLYLVWDTLTNLYLSRIEEFPVVFESVRFKRATVLNGDKGVKFLVNIMLHTGHFEICESGSTVCTGIIRYIKDIEKEFLLEDVSQNNTNDNIKMTREDIYKETYLRRYYYKGMFQGMIESDLDGLNGKIEWKGNFCTFLDTMCHLVLSATTSRQLMLPTSIQQVIIDPVKHLKMSEETAKILNISRNSDLNIVKSGGIEIIGFKCSAAPSRQHLQDPPFLETYEFVPYETENQYDLASLVGIATQIVIQNTIGQVKRIDVCEIITNEVNNKIIDIVQSTLDRQALTKARYFSSTFATLKRKYDIFLIFDDVLSSVNMSKIVDHLQPTGFILYKGNYDKIQNMSLEIIFQGTTVDNDSIYLLRPTVDFPTIYTVVNVRISDFDWLEELKTVIQNKDNKIVYLLSHNEYTSGIIGFVKCLLCEPISVSIKSIFINNNNDKFCIEDAFYQNQLKKDLNYNVYKNNKWGTYVHLPLKGSLDKQDVENAAITLSTIGDLSSLYWIQRPVGGLRIFEEGSEQVYVHYAALNFRDVMVATGKLALAAISKLPTALSVNLGVEYSGITSQGKRVMGMVGSESLSMQVFNDPYFTWEVPKEWSLQEASTIPCAYATCYYALILRGQIKPGESILIHSGTGGVGLAAITIALSMGCEIFTTVSTKEKREFLKTKFPTLKDQNIGNSRNKSFEKMVKINTRGRGVDLVLNSLADDLFQASMRCLSPIGRFIEIGKVDLQNASPIPSPMFLNNISFHGIHLDQFFYPQNDFKKEIQKLVKEGIETGVVKPLPTVAFDETEVEAAFRYMASGKHKGKVVIQLRKEESSAKLSRTISAVPRIHFDPRKSYILVGGLGGFGLELADWLITRGATKIILNSRREINNGYQAYCLKKWSQFKNVSVKINTNDTSKLKEAEELISYAQSFGPVGGIFNMALVLKDALFVNQTVENFRDVFKTKISSGKNLDIISRKLCKELDYFIVMSSVACGRGNNGQTNYGMANSALEMLCEKRKEDGLPGLAVQWGSIGDVGFVARGNADVALENMRLQKIASCLEALEKFMLKCCTIGSSVVLSKHKVTDETNSIKTAVEVVAHILGINDLSMVNKSVSLSELGLDSLMLTEIKQSLYRNFELDLDPEEIRNLTLNRLTELQSNDTLSDETISKGDKSSEQQDTDMLKLDTFLLSEEAVVKINDSAQFKNNIFLIHSIEGNIDNLKHLAKQLKATIYGLQCTSENICNSIIDYSQYFIKKIKEIQSNGPYYICGYSYGSSLGVEITLQLEEMNEMVKLICIDGSPGFVSNSLAYYHLVQEDGSTKKAEQSLLTSLYSSFTGISAEEATELIEKHTSWEESLEAVSKSISRINGINKVKVSLSISALRSRTLAGFKYKPSTQIECNVLLIRRNINPFIGEDYNLKEVCKQAVEIKKIPGNHKSMILGENAKEVAEAIHTFFKI